MTSRGLSLSSFLSIFRSGSVSMSYDRVNALPAVGRGRVTDNATIAGSKTRAVKEGRCHSAGTCICFFFSSLLKLDT